MHSQNNLVQYENCVKAANVNNYMYDPWIIEWIGNAHVSANDAGYTDRRFTVLNYSIPYVRSATLV